MTFRENLVSVFRSLLAQLIFIVILASFCGLLVGIVWYQSRLMWNEYLNEAFSSGVTLSEQIMAINQSSLDQQFFLQISGFSISAEKPKRIITSDNSLSLRFADLPAYVYETQLSLLFNQGASIFEGNRLGIRIFSPNKRYELSAIENTNGIGLATRLGDVVKTLANSCGASIMFVEAGSEYWLRIEAADIWGCAATPPDWRLPVLLFSGIVLIIIVSFAMRRAEIFELLALRIATSARNGQYQPLELEGSNEARKITSAVNKLFTNERERLEQRALLLSGVSHDLGTPATRLKLRTALIADQQLRQKLDADIDHMTDMIEGVLNYTRGEISSEPRRQVSMVALVQSLVDDYADTGQPVTLEPIKDIVITKASSIFDSSVEHSDFFMTNQTRLLCYCRPNQVRRALTNLIDNAIKYGKSATLLLNACAENVTISVCDEGGSAGPVDLKAYTAAFERGENAAIHKGVGLGLTIVAGVARSHGGQLNFKNYERGSRVSLSLPRS